MAGMRRTLRYACAFLLLCGLRNACAEELPALGADGERITVSGLSSGAYMAGQFQVAYSRTVTGAALVAGGPYGCAHTPGSDTNPFWLGILSLNLARAQNSCMEDGWWWWPTVPSAASLFDYTQSLAAQGSIDPLDGLAADKVYLFSSSADGTVERGVVEAAASFYREAGIGAAHIHFDKNDKAAHAFLTEGDKPACGSRDETYLNGCGLDQARIILDWLAGPLKPAGTADEASFIRFDQTSFSGNLSEAYLAPQGMAYIPRSCRDQPGCRIHVVFHGCKQGLPAIDDRFVKGAGYARWAESNRIVVLFPQAVAGSLNPNGCWDWWGYTGPRFLQRDAVQMRAVQAMIGRLAARP
jgi:poly(3-hydroxybutyrate) depolymerase